jgi:GNAT superfamily N-acetyltransferase
LLPIPRRAIPDWKNGAAYFPSTSPDAFERAVRHSAVSLGVYAPAADRLRQIGFARVVTGCATFAYLTDVFIREPYRGQGLSKRLMEAVMAHPELQGLRRFLLVAEDAGGLYERYGFRGLGEEASHGYQIFRESPESAARTAMVRHKPK